MNVYRARAPAKVNLGLFLGPTRAADRRHELVTVMQSISLADELTLEAAPGGVARDEVLCPGLPGPSEQNLAALALGAFRARTGWDAPPQRLTIAKRIPVAAGLGGGSADAAAALRLATHASGLGDRELLRELAFELGADVPAQIAPGRWLATGAGERLRALPGKGPAFGLLVLPLAAALSTAEVYAEADRLGLVRPADELEDRRRGMLAAWETAGQDHGDQRPGGGATGSRAWELLHNDLQRAAVSLCPQIGDALREVGEVGADLAFVSGSGPTVVGLFAPRDARGARAGPGRAPSGPDAPNRAAEAAARLWARVPQPVCSTPVDGDFGRPIAVVQAGPVAGPGGPS